MCLVETFESDIGEPSRGDATRRKLLAAALEIFAADGFDGASTRTIAQKAGANQQAINYYFRGKRELYFAVADEVSGKIMERVAAPFREASEIIVAARKQKTLLEPAQARALLTSLMESFVQLLIDPEMLFCTGFIIREQMATSDAFLSIYEKMMKPFFLIVSELMAAVTGKHSTDEAVRLKALSLMGSAMVFRMARAGAMRHLDWNKIGQDEQKAVLSLIRETVARL